MIHTIAYGNPSRANGWVPARDYRKHRAQWTAEDRRRVQLQVLLGPSRDPRRKALVTLPKVEWMNREEI